MATRSAPFTRTPDRPDVTGCPDPPVGTPTERRRSRRWRTPGGVTAMCPERRLRESTRPWDLESHQLRAGSMPADSESDCVRNARLVELRRWLDGRSERRGRSGKSLRTFSP
jgi:hypothetical protein